MNRVQDVEVTVQDDVRSTRKEIVTSAYVSRGHYYGPRPGRPSASAELSVQDQIMLLHKQLALLRRQAELGVFISPDSIGRVERLARSLEAAA